MKVHDIKQILGNTPHMSLKKAYAMSRFIHHNNVKDILELGFCSLCFYLLYGSGS
jgi:hypothetical protein